MLIISILLTSDFVQIMRVSCITERHIRLHVMFDLTREKRFFYSSLYIYHIFCWARVNRFITPAEYITIQVVYDKV